MHSYVCVYTIARNCNALEVMYTYCKRFMYALKEYGVSCRFTLSCRVIIQSGQHWQKHSSVNNNQYFNFN